MATSDQRRRRRPRQPRAHRGRRVRPVGRVRGGRQRARGRRWRTSPRSWRASTTARSTGSRSPSTSPAGSAARPSAGSTTRASGTCRWPQAGPTTGSGSTVGETPEARPLDAVEVVQRRRRRARASRSTSTRSGVPVLVKASYFPNWQVAGRRGPYRVAPNLMVVVPTDTHVELTYGRTGVEYAVLRPDPARLRGPGAAGRRRPRLPLPPAARLVPPAELRRDGADSTARAGWRRLRGDGDAGRPDDPDTPTPSGERHRSREAPG